MASIPTQSAAIAAFLQNNRRNTGSTNSAKAGGCSSDTSQGGDGQAIGSDASVLQALMDGFESKGQCGSQNAMQGHQSAGAQQKAMAQMGRLMDMAQLAKAMSGEAKGACGGGNAASAQTAAAQSTGSGGPGASNPLAKNLLGKGGLDELGGMGGGMFEDMVAKFMFKVIKQQQELIKKMMAKYKAMSAAGALMGGAGGGAGQAMQESRQLLFEQLKNEMQKMQQMVQSLSNVLNTLHQGAMNAIRNIRA